MHCSLLEGKKLFSPIFANYGFHQFKDKSESFSPPPWDPWELDLVSFMEHLFNKGMVPKKTQPLDRFAAGQAAIPIAPAR